MRSKKKKLELVPIVYDQNELEEMNFQILLNSGLGKPRQQEEWEWNLAELDNIANPGRIDRPEYEEVEVSDETFGFWNEDERERKDSIVREEWLEERRLWEEKRERQDEEYEEYRKKQEREKERWKDGFKDEGTETETGDAEKNKIDETRIFLIRGKGDRLEMQGLKRTFCAKDKNDGGVEVWCELVANKTTRMEKRLEDARKKDRWLPFLFQNIMMGDKRFDGIYAWAKPKDATEPKKRQGKRTRWMSLKLAKNARIIKNGD